MRAIRRISNNAAVCLDGKGRELIALGKGVGFGEIPHEVRIEDVTRTFYGVDDRYLALIEELDPRELEFAAQLADLARTQVSYELSPNLPITLADHVAFALKRAREHMVVSMPLAYDVQQQYPVEYHIGEIAVSGMEKTFGVHMPRGEASGVALAIVNGRVAATAGEERRERREERAIESAVGLIESCFGIVVDRESFDFSRFATHVRYLLGRIEKGEPLETSMSALYPEISQQYPQASRCADSIAEVIARAYKSELTEEEKVYLILHITRVVDRTRDGR